MKGSKIVGGMVAAVGSALTWPLPRRDRGKALAYATERLTPVFEHQTAKGVLRFACPSRSAFRGVDIALRTEPETMRWLDTHVQAGDCLWDIGANVGAWSLYAARVREAQVVSFEPSAQSFGALYRNILLNRLDERISAYCIALSDETGAGTFYLHSAEPGGALNSFGAPENLHGNFQAELRQAMFSFRIDDFVKQRGVTPPDHIKLDVDGIEELILKGAVETLPKVKSLIVECETERPDADAWYERITATLGAAGFRIQAASPCADGRNEVFLNSRVGAAAT
ncbi:MAG: FkbM family methyltransferase [Caulobacter sp.]|nr:FkbM family methyltransferase [Caulobacter sp.]